jgi:cell wall-associated NlpC family hydrolase
VPSNPGSSPLPPGQLLPGAYTQADAAAVTAAQEEVARLRGLVATASQESMAADAARDEALEAARLAHWEALMSNVRAEQARRLLARYAAGVYRSGGGSTGLVTIVNGALDDPGAVLDEQAYLRRAADQKSSEVEQARQVLEEARELAAAADTAEQEAQQAAATAAAARTELADALAQAREQLRIAESSAVSAQTLIGPDGCPTQVPAGTLRGSAAGRDVADLCARSVASAATPEAALAIKFAFRSLGAPYACKGIGRSLPFRFDCSSLVSRAYSEGAGLNTAGDGWAPSTRDMVPWDGVPLAPWAAFVAPDQARPGDIVLYDTGGAIYRHVVMLVADGLMLHTNSCGDVAKVEDFWGFGTPTATYLVSRRVDPEKAR